METAYKKLSCDCHLWDVWFMVMMSDLQGFPFSPCRFLGMVRAAPLQTSTCLNSVHAFGNRRPLIRGADGQRCPSLPSVCSQIDACATAMPCSRTDGKHSRCGLASVNDLLAFTNAYFTMCERNVHSLCKGDLHGTAGRDGWFRDRLLWGAPCDLLFFCETCWPLYPQSSQTHPHTSQVRSRYQSFPF